MTTRILAGLAFEVESPSKYIYRHREGNIILSYAGRERKWRVSTEAGATASGYATAHQAADLLHASLFNKGYLNG